MWSITGENMFHFPVAAVDEQFNVIVLHFKFQSYCSEIEVELQVQIQPERILF